MNTKDRKHREMQEREAIILECARPMFIEGGYNGLNMDRLTSMLEYSKGTIYNHFSCKEEIIITLAIQTLEKRLAMFEKASLFQGTSRERIAAIGTAAELFVKLYPDHFRVEQTIRLDSIWDKTSEERRQVMSNCERRCIGLVSGVVRDGIASGDLNLNDSATPEEIVFGLWSLSFGGYSIISTSNSLQELGISEPFQMLRHNYSRFLDGIQWKPLSSEVDYDAVFERVSEEVFGNELQQITT
ncbi:MAG: TetR/AcrR family transcriptional regulator [Gimesia sp.]|nr:TetR/AcrR family transcriptional regulator [Gimesia sp.]